MGGFQNGLRGRVKVTTRCLWVDRGKLLEALQKAATAALASLQLDATLGLVEHTVGLALRKVVQKYSNRKPDVIVIATEGSTPLQDRNSSSSPNGSPVHEKYSVQSTRERRLNADWTSRSSQPVESASGEAQVSLTGQTIAPVDNSFGVDRLVSSPNLRRRSEDITSKVTDKFDPKGTQDLPAKGGQYIGEEARGAIKVKTSKIEKETVTSFRQLKSSLTTTKFIAAEGSENTTPVSTQTTIETFDGSLNSVPSVIPKDTAAEAITDTVMTPKHEEDEENSQLAAPTRRRKWKSNEVILLIELRKQKEIDFHRGQGKKGLWKGVSEALAQAGFDRSPDQCKTVWFSLVKKYKSSVEDNKNSVTSGEPFFFYDAMHAALAKIEETEIEGKFQ